MKALNILGFCGSLRAGSFNKKLLLLSCDLLKNKNCIVTLLDLKSLGLPIYDQEIEESTGLPSGAQKLIEAINSADALLIASPEYNGSVSGALKNAIDWASRAEANPFVNKPILMVGTSTGGLGAVKSLIHLRLILSQLKALPIPAQVTVPFAEKSFDSAGLFTGGPYAKQLESATNELVKFTEKICRTQ